MQEHLKRLGFEMGEIDGDFGPKTLEGVRWAQRRFGIEEDGMVGPEFQRKVNSSCADDSGRGNPLPPEEEKDIDDISSGDYNKDDLNRSLNQMKWMIQELINKIRL